jgi:hypothetical protein
MNVRLIPLVVGLLTFGFLACVIIDAVSSLGGVQP